MNPDDTKIAVIKELFEMLFSSKSGLSALERRRDFSNAATMKSLKRKLIQS